jgi:uncharacterized protein YejL (UPF0352 family)
VFKMAQKHIDLLVVDTKKELVNVINKSGLPLSVSAMIIADINNVINDQLEHSVAQLERQYAEEVAIEAEAARAKQEAPKVEAEIVK